MEKQEAEQCEKILNLFNEMYFENIQGKALVAKFLEIQNFGRIVRKYKDPPKMEVVKKSEPIKPIDNAPKKIKPKSKKKRK